MTSWIDWQKKAPSLGLKEGAADGAGEGREVSLASFVAYFNIRVVPTRKPPMPFTKSQICRR